MDSRLNHDAVTHGVRGEMETKKKHVTHDEQAVGEQPPQPPVWGTSSNCLPDSLVSSKAHPKSLVDAVVLTPHKYAFSNTDLGPVAQALVDVLLKFVQKKQD